jgi:hypothetical protein
MRKPRSDSKLMTLPEEQQAKLSELLLAGTPLYRVKEWCLKELSIETSLAALSNYWHTCVSAHMLARRTRAAGLADDLATAAQKSSRFDEAALEAIRQKAFELAVAPNAEPGDVKSLFMLVLKSRDQDLQAKGVDIQLRRLEMLEHNAAAAKASLNQVLTEKGGLSPETLAKIEEAAKLL